MEHSRQITTNFEPPETPLDLYSAANGDSLSDVYAFDEVQRYMYRSDDLSREEQLQLEVSALDAIAGEFRRSLPYKSEARPWAQSDAASCYTYTFLMSDVAEELGMVSRIVYCNGHAFNLILTSGGNVHMVNTESRHLWIHDVLNNPLTEGLLSEEVLTKTLGLAQDGSLSVDSHMQRLKRHSDLHLMRSYQAVIIPWLQAEHPMATIMAPEYGKKALLVHSVLEDALRSRDIGVVADVLPSFVGFNPQRETHEKLNPDIGQMKKCVTSWAMDNKVASEDMAHMIDLFGQAYPDTPYLHRALGDMFRKLAQHRRASGYLERAQTEYETAEQCRHIAFVHEKLSKARKLMRELMPEIELIPLMR